MALINTLSYEYDYHMFHVQEGMFFCIFFYMIFGYDAFFFMSVKI